MDAQLITQVLINLINNAIKYTEEGTVRISISFDREAGMLTCSVTDSGMGIREEDIDKLFREADNAVINA